VGPDPDPLPVGGSDPLPVGGRGPDPLPVGGAGSDPLPVGGKVGIVGPDPPIPLETQAHLDPIPPIPPPTFPDPEPVLPPPVPVGSGASTSHLAMVTFPFLMAMSTMYITSPSASSTSVALPLHFLSQTIFDFLQFSAFIS